LRLAGPAVIVDLSPITELDHITPSATGGVRIGAMATQRRVEQDPNVGSRAQLLAQALPYIGHVTIRNRGTVCGSIAHADPAAELPAVAVAADATVVLASTRGERDVAAEQFFAGYLTSVAEPDELVREVRFPALSTRTGTAFSEVSRRHGDFALAGAAAVVQVGDDGTVVSARIVLTGVGSTPVRARAAEESLIDATPSSDAWAAAAAATRAEIDPSSDLHATADYRRHVAGVLVERVLADAVAEAQR
jgi:carbon-monoxide dehydrogenase medium subunit